MKTYQISGLVGVAKTVAGAKEDAMAKVSEALEGSYQPEMIVFRGHMALVWREPVAGWLFCIVNSDGSQNYRNYCDNKEHAIRLAKMILAQNGWDGEEEQSPILSEGQERFAFWAKYHKYYNGLVSQGIDPEQAWKLTLDFMGTI